MRASPSSLVQCVAPGYIGIYGAAAHRAPTRSGNLRAGTSLVLAGVMGQRANRSGKVFPAGIVALVSALMTICYAKALA